ncbi:MAG: protein BatD [Planctomycetes bacterium]|nr:protein BatD [Planctomycetota bacterium]
MNGDTSVNAPVFRHIIVTTMGPWISTISQPFLLTGPLLCLLLALLGVQLDARGEVSVSAEIHPPRVSLGEAAVLEVQITGSTKASPPAFPEIAGLGFSRCSQSTQTFVVNGRVSQNIAFSCQVMPERAGNYTLQGITLEIDRQVHAVPPVSLEVAPASRTNDVLAIVGLSKPEIVVGEPVLLTVDWLLRKDIQGYEIRIPWFPPRDFTVMDPIHRRSQQGQSLPNEDDEVVVINPQTAGQKVFFQRGQAQHDDREYTRFRLQRLLTTLKPGSYRFEPTQILCRIVTGAKSSKRRNFFGDEDPFEAFGFGNRSRVELKSLLITADPVVLDVKPLPEEGRPEGFSGSVGSFELEVSASPRKVKVGDPVTLTLTVRGRGSFETVTCPGLESVLGFREYEAESKVSCEADGAAFRGEKTFSKPLVPTEESVREIPRVRFSYFDPERREYQTVVRGPFPIEVAPSLSDGTVGLVTAPEPGQKKMDVRPAAGVFPLRKPSLTQFRDRSLPWYLRPGLWLLLPLPAFLCLACALFERRRSRLRSDPGLQRSQKALRHARQRLEEARRTEGSEAYQKVSEALTGYLADKFNLSPAGVDVGNASQLILPKGVGDEPIVELVSCLNLCDQGRFGGDASKAAREQVIQQAEKVLTSLARTLES